ncbi:MAG: phage tail protein, partial [Gemmatimonadetes bacterium]|nr:phage tail protein [Gemmatimonadota bacterium]
TIAITADADITIESTSGKLVLKGKNGVEVTSGAAIKAEAQADAELKASGQMTIKGATVNLN